MPVIEFDPPDRFIADSVGPPGERVFFLQAASPGRVMTVSLEKEQVAVLGQRLDTLLDNAAASEADPDAVDAVADNAPLDTPIEDEFRVQELSLAWDLDRRMVVIEAHESSAPDSDLDDEEDELDEPADLDASLARLEQELPGLAAAAEAALSAELEEDDEPGPGDTVMRVILSPAQARAFAARCARAVEGGRPSCPFCGLPLDPGGHICPRANGYRR